MTDTYLTRQTLLRRLKSTNDEQAWEELVTNYRPFICSIINKMGINQSDVDNLAQTVLIKIWESLGNFDHRQKKGCFRNWLYKITKNSVLTYISHDKKYNIKISEASENSKFSSPASPDVDEIIHNEWKKFIFEKAVNNIKNKVSQPMWEAFQSGLNGEDEEATAQRLGLEKNTVNKYKNRVKYKLVLEIENLRELLE